MVPEKEAISSSFFSLTGNFNQRIDISKPSKVGDIDTMPD
jgi:hypothetical protein